jgi:hypothetical protein
MQLPLLLQHLLSLTDYFCHCCTAATTAWCLQLKTLTHCHRPLLESALQCRQFTLVLLSEQRDAAATASALLQHHRHWRAAQPRLYSTLLPLLHRLLADAAVLLGDAACGGSGSDAAAALLHISTAAAGSSSSSEERTRHDQRRLNIAHEVSCMFSLLAASCALCSA